MLNSPKPLALATLALAIEGEWWNDVLLFLRIVGNRETNDALCLKLEETRLKMRSTQGNSKHGQCAMEISRLEAVASSTIISRHLFIET